MTSSGTVMRFRADKGFGFITAADGSEVFLHIKACTDGMIPVEGDHITFDVEESKVKPGQQQAANVSGCTGKPGETGKGGPAGSLQGVVKTFNAEKGFGFITAADGTDQFCHLNAVVDGSTPQPGDTLTYDVEDSRSKPGTMTCCNVRGGTGYPAKGKGKDAWGSGGGYAAAKGGGKDQWGSPYGGGGGKDAWGGAPAWGGDAWGGAPAWGGKGDDWGGKGDSWGGKGGGGKGDSWGGGGGKGDSWGGGGGDSWGAPAKGGGKPGPVCAGGWGGKGW